MKDIDILREVKCTEIIRIGYSDNQARIMHSGSPSDMPAEEILPEDYDINHRRQVSNNEKFLFVYSSQLTQGLDYNSRSFIYLTETC